MEINKTVNDGKMNISLVGRLDTTTAPEFEKELVLDGINELVFDFANLDYVSSAGLRVILGAQKAMNKNSGTLVIKNVKPEIMEVFDMTGFSDILTIE